MNSSPLIPTATDRDAAAPSPAALLEDLARDGVHLWAEDGALRFRAPAGALTEEHRSALAAHRAEVLDLLAARDAPRLTPDPASRHEPFPLTEVQSAYLVGRGSAYDFGGVACHAYAELELGDLDPERLRTAWRSLVRRHDMLRAVVRPEGYQEVLPEAPGESFTATDLGEADPAPHVERTRERLRDHVPDPHAWPLVRLHATRGRGTTVLHLSVDLMAADHASVRLLLAELREAYEHPDAAPAAPEASFRDYVLARRGLREGTGYHRDRAYWDARLDELPAAPELPLADRAADASARFTRLAGRLDAAEWEGLRTRAAAHGLTPSAVALAAYAEVLGQWSRHGDFTLNLPVSRRLPLHPDLPRVVGDFTSLSLLAVRTGDGASFAERAQTRQGRLLEELDHGLYTGTEVLAELSRRRGEAAVLMPVVFTGALGADDAESAPDRSWALREVHGLSQTPQVWIDCQVSRDADGLALRWDVREGVLIGDVAGEAFAAYERLLRALATSDAPWEADDVVPLPAEQAAVRERVNATAAPLAEDLLHEAPLRAALATPEATAVVHPEGELTHAGLWGRVAGVAEALRRAGAAPGERVGIVMDKGVEQVVAALAASLAGTVYVPVDTTQPEARRARILADAGVRAILTQSWLPAPGPADLAGGDAAGQAAAEAPAVIAVDEVPAGPAPSGPPPRLVEPGDPAYVIYTSGSTGTPKGVVVSHRSALNTLDGVDGLLEVGPGDRVLALAALGFDLSVYDLFGVLARGGSVVVPDAARRGDPSHWAELLEEHEVTLWNSVPAQAGMLADYLDSAPERSTSALRALLLSGDWIPLALPGRLRGLLPGARLYSLGGATEGSIWSIHHPVETVDPSWPSVPYGRPLPNQAFHVLDEKGRDRPDWVPGELHIGGEGVALGYLGDPLRTAERFVAHPRTGERLYRTGDLGRYRPGGDLEFLGREDDQVKIRGHRVELAEVEAAVASHPSVAGVAVLAPEEREGRRLTAFVETAARPAGTDRSVPGTVAEAARRAAAAEIGELDRTELAAFLERMRATACEAMTLTLTGAGLFSEAGASHTEAEVLAALRADRRHHRLVRRWLAALVDAGRLRRTADGSLEGLDRVTAAEHTAGWDRLDELEARVGYGTDVLRYMRACTGRLPELLSAELDVRSLLFPGDADDAASGAYRDNLAIRHLNSAAAAALSALAEGRTADRPLRVLEVGAGTGGTTEAAVAALAGHPVEYLFTDVSPFFLTEARERFAAFPWVSFGLYDIERTAAEQGISPHSFDAVLAANVLHDAVDADAALARLREVLVSGGHLLAIETTLEHDPALMVSMEFMEGLEGGHHDARTAADQTFLSRDQWLEALAGAGAVGTLALPEDDAGLEGTGQGLFLARLKADRVPAEPQELARHAAARLPEYMVPARWQVLDRLPLTGNGKVDRKRLVAGLPAVDSGPGVGTVAAAPADELERALAELWSDLLDRPGVGREDDFFDLGGDSLLVARMVGRLGEVLPESGEEIEWEVVLRHLLRTPTVAGLATYLRDLTGQVEAAADRARDPYVPLSGPGAGAVTALVHAGTGTLVPYRSLITEIRRRAAGRGTVVGLELPDVAEFLEADPAAVITRWAADYARALLERGGDRFHVVGYCLGGLVATEVARSLTEAGAEVASLTAISTHRPPFRLEDELISEYAFAVMMGIDPVAAGFPAEEDRVSAASDALLEATPGVLPDGAIGRLEGEFADVAERFRALAATPRAERIQRLCAALPPSAGTYAPEALEEMFRIFRQSVFSISRYEPAPYAGDVTFLRHSGAYPFPGNKESVTSYWERLVLGDLRIRDVPGDHFGMLSAPYAPGILQHLEAITGGDVVA